MTLLDCKLASESEEKSSSVHTLTGSTMPRTCATIAIIVKARRRWLMLAVTMTDPITRGVCARTATFQSITFKERIRR